MTQDFTQQTAEDAVIACLDLPGMHSFALESLLTVGSIEWSTGITTAAVECAVRPRLMLNRTFVETQCRTPARLLTLILHELAHVSLGHTRLYPVVTLAHNIAFDAIINRMVVDALMLAGGPWQEALEFFADNAGKEDPVTFVLGPPPGWPKRPDWNASQRGADALRDIHRRLWRVPVFNGQGHDVTYGELLAALQAACTPLAASALSGDEADERLRDIAASLLGSHGQTEAERAAAAGDRNARLSDLLPSVMSTMARSIPGAGRGGPRSITRVAPAPPDDSLVRALREACRKVLVADESRTRRVDVIQRPSVGVDRSQDRRSMVRTSLAKQLRLPPPLLFATQTTRTQPRRSGGAIYLDVSGSMDRLLPACHAALVPLRRALDFKVHCFSTEVATAVGSAFDRGLLPTTGGTDIAPVLSHVLARGTRSPRRVLILSDGYFTDPPRSLCNAVHALGVALHLAVVGPGPLHESAKWLASSTRLPAIPSTPGVFP